MRLKNLLLTAGLAVTSLLAAIPQAKATTCPNATAITSLPVTNQALVCGTANDQSATTIVQNCSGSTSYYGGLEALYTFTPTITGTIRVEYTGQTWTGIFIYSGCPSTTGTTVVACTTSSASTKFVDVAVTSGITYYLMFDTYPSPASPCAGTFSILLPCTGMPTAGTASGTVTSTCAGGTSVLSLAGQSAGPGITYQWQSSTTSATTGFSNIASATGASYTTAALSATTYYRAIVKCTTTGDSMISNAVTVTVTTPTTTTATLPYSQSFENWISTCSVTDRPSTQWTTSPFNGEAAWRRDDQGASAGWTAATTGGYTPTFTAGAYSARFHSYYAPSGAFGSMMLNVNLSAAGTKLISFDYINVDGSDSLYVEVSTNGGASYTTLGGRGIAATWTPVNFSTTATSATAIVRFRAKSDYGATDIGMDNLNISVVTCALPTAVNASAVTATSATVGWTAPASAPALGYRWELRTSGAAGSGATGLVSSNTVANTTTSVPFTTLSGSTTYSFYVRSICSAGDSSAWVSTSFSTSVDCAGAPVITACGVSQSFTIPTGQGSWGGYLQIPGGGNVPYATPGVEKLYKFTATMTGAYTLEVTATNSQWTDYFFKPVSSGCNDTGWTFIDDVLTAPYTVTFNLTAGTQYYILADPESTTSAPAQTFRIICPPTCGQPTSPTVTATTTTSATLGWTQPALGSPSSWQISYGTGITSPATGTMVIAPSNPYVLTPLTTATNYTYYVRAICGPGDTSAWSPAFTFATACLPFAAPFYQGFASGSMPPCWTNSNTTGVAGSIYTLWRFSGAPDYGPAANGRPAGTYAWVDASSPFNVVLELTSPSIDLSTVTNPILEFEWYKNNTDAAPIPQVNNNLRVQGNPGTGWVTLFDDTSNQAAWRTVSILLPPAFANTTAQFRFVVDKNLSNDFYDEVLLDSVRVIQCTLPTVAFGSDTTLCGTGASLTLDGGIGTSYNWSTGATTQTINVSTPGTYSVTVINGSSACRRSDTIDVNTGVIPVVNLGPDTNVCGNVLSFQLNAGNPGANYAWSSPVQDLSMFTTQVIDLGPIINAGNIAMSGSPVNTAPVIATVTNASGCKGSDTVIMSVIFTARVSDFNISGTDPTFTFTPALDSFATTYAWTFGDGGTANVTTGSPVSHTYSTNGTYTVTLMVGNQCGVTDTVTKTRQVTNDVKDVTADGTTITLYPNPTATDAVLTVDGSAKLRGYQVLNAAGAVVAERTLDAVTRTTLSTGAFAPGIYTLRIQLDKGVVVRKLEVIK